jgi:hypothetical protein
LLCFYAAIVPKETSEMQQLVILALLSGPVVAASSEPLSTRQIATDVSKATVSIRCALPGGVTASGSGFITDSSGTIVTNYHVVKGAERIEVRTAAGDLYEVTAIRAVDRRRDIAVIQIPAFKLPTVTLGDSDNLGPGEPIVVIGNALGVLENSVTTGVVSGIREVEGNKLIQMSAAVSPGNSGGPVVNGKEEVVAITVSKLTSGESLNFAIPINFVRGNLAQPAQQGLTMLRESEEKSLFENTPRAFPKRWHSTASNIDRTVTISEDVMLVELKLPEQVVQAGGQTWGEFRKNGDQWAGTFTSRIPCAYQSFLRPPTHKVCLVTGPAELSLVTPTKIVGFGMRSQQDSKFDCEDCTYKPPLTKSPFTWIPADQ